MIKYDSVKFTTKKDNGVLNQGIICYLNNSGTLLGQNFVLETIDTSRGVKEGVTKNTPQSQKVASNLCEYKFGARFLKFISSSKKFEKVYSRQQKICEHFCQIKAEKTEDSKLHELYDFTLQTLKKTASYYWIIKFQLRKKLNLIQSLKQEQNDCEII